MSLVHEAIAACTISGVDPLIEVGESIAGLLPKKPTGDPLAAIVALAQERLQQRLEDSPEPTPPSRTNKNSDAYTSADEGVDRGFSFKIP